jgi:uncharacterized cupredoxin-like copper-binding protein
VRTQVYPHVTAVLAALILLGGCATRHSGSPAGAILHVTERDFRITAPARVPAGRVRIVVHNDGPDAHELIVIRASNGLLPLRGDGITVDEEAVQRATVGTLEPGQPGATRELDVDLRPGIYELICNMAGHYLGGMEAPITVR